MGTSMHSIQTTRYPDWPIRLNKYIAKVQHDPFVMGKHDCCTFAAGAVEAMTGIDPMEEFRGKYATWREAVTALKALGENKLQATLVAKFGEPIGGAYAQKGDVVMYEGACGIMLGLFGMFIGGNGLMYVRLRNIDCTFRVP